ncbi:C2 domain-containing protein [Spinellus fusiger]|nr:C2 domain-containing protein [Spinellus fusiger]
MSLFSSHSAHQGVLSVTVVEGRKLHSEDLAGQNDSYVELWLNEDYKQRTGEIKSDNNPVWNETFTFNIEEGSSLHKLHLKVLDKDFVGKDKIGEAKLNISEAFNGNPVDEWVNLPAHLGLTSHGEIHIYAQFTPN